MSISLSLGFHTHKSSDSNNTSKELWQRLVERNMNAPCGWVIKATHHQCNTGLAQMPRTDPAQLQRWDSRSKRNYIEQVTPRVTYVSEICPPWDTRHISEHNQVVSFNLPFKPTIQSFGFLGGDKSPSLKVDLTFFLSQKTSFAKSCS